MPILSWFQVAALVLPLCVAVDAAAQGAPQPIFSGSDPHWKQISKADCLIYDPIPQPGETVDWSGQCVGRVASGPGVITWKDATGRVTGTTKGTVTNGVEQGLDESKAISTDGGTVKIQKSMIVNGLANGLGTFTIYKNGIISQVYIGNFVNGEITGQGEVTLYDAKGVATATRSGIWANGNPERPGSVVTTPVVGSTVASSAGQEAHAQAVNPIPPNPIPPWHVNAIPVTNPYPDVLGVTIGMTMQQAKEKLGNSYKFMTVVPVRDNPETEDVYAIAPQEIVSLETYRGKLIFINHLQVFTDATRPSLNIVPGELNDKYGDPVTVEVYTNKHIMRYGDRGKIAGRYEDCSVKLRGYDPQVLRMAGIVDDIFNLYGGFLGFPDLNLETRECGTVVDAELHLHGGGGLDVSIHNTEEPFRVIAETRQQEADRKRLVEGQNKPKL